MTIAQECMLAANVHITLGIILAVVAIAVGIFFDVLAYNRFDWDFILPASFLGVIVAALIGLVTVGNLEACKKTATAHTKEYSYSTHEEAQAKFNELLELDGAEMFHIVKNSDDYWGLCYDDNHVPQNLTKYYDKIRVEECKDGHLVVTYTEYQPTDVAENNKKLYQAQLDAVKMLEKGD